MRRTLLLLSLLSTALTGCGEIESVILPTRPKLDEFPDVQARLIEAGCSANNGCHSVVVGNFQVTPAPKSRGQLEAEYLLTKSHLDLDQPGRSSLLTANLLGDPNNTGHVVCFTSVCSCTYQAVYRWIDGTGIDAGVDEELCPGGCEEDNCL